MSLAGLRVGLGIDFHRYVDDGKPLKLGGVLITDEFKVAAHSDGDCVIHALMDAILGATGSDDIGVHFSDTDDQFRDADSKQLLKLIIDSKLKDYIVLNADVTVIAQVPKLTHHKEIIKSSLEQVLNTQVSVKATTTEAMGAIGNKEGVASLVIIAILKRECDG